MSVQLVIAEKPSVARSIAGVIGADQKRDGYMEGNGYLVSWCIGHLVSLADAGAYDERFKKWRYDDLPILPQEWQYIIPAEKKGQFAVLRSLMERPDVTGLVCATDAGREGELIFRFVYQMAGCKKPFKRLWISSMEDAAIREGFAHLKPGADYDDLYQSALCRAQADWLVGINATRLFSILYHKTLTVGRVQTPTLNMLVDREAKISNFKKEKYHVVHAVMSGSDTGGTITTILPVALTVLVLAGIVIYSIFYVSVSKNVRNFGKLRTIGLTKKQMKKMMWAESRSMLAKGVIGGVFISGVIGFLGNSNGFRVNNFLWYGFIVAICICFMALLAVRVPTKIAANVSPLEGTRFTFYNGKKAKSSKSKRKARHKLTPQILGKINLRRSLKKTILTTIMLSLSGIIFVTVVTVANSLNAERMARFFMFPNGDLQLRIQSVETSTFDTSGNSEDRVSKLQRENNPLNDELISQLYSIKGVEKVTAENAVNLYIQYQENTLFSSIAGSGGLTSTLTQEQCAMISDALIEGTSDYDTLNTKNGILVRQGASSLNIGDVVQLSGTDANGNQFHMEVPVVGIFEQGEQQQILPLSSGSDFYVTDVTAQNFTGIVDQTGIVSISSEAGYEQQVSEAVKGLSDMNDQLDLYTLENSVSTRQALFDMQIQPLFMIALILFLFSVISLTNTQLTNLLERKQELALLQSVGMTKKQQQEMISTEEHFYLKIALLSTLILGSLLSAGICFYIENTSHCIQFQYPWLLVGAFLGVVIITNFLVGKLAFQTTIKGKLIDRLRTQE